MKTSKVKRATTTAQKRAKDRQIVLLDQRPLRRKAAAECSRAMTRLEKAKAEWKRFQQEDQAAFSRWVSSTFSGSARCHEHHQLVASRNFPPAGRWVVARFIYRLSEHVVGNTRFRFRPSRLLEGTRSEPGSIGEVARDRGVVARIGEQRGRGDRRRLTGDIEGLRRPAGSELETASEKPDDDERPQRCGCVTPPPPARDPIVHGRWRHAQLLAGCPLEQVRKLIGHERSPRLLLRLRLQL